MSTLLIALIAFVTLGVAALGIGFLLWRSQLRYAKTVERGIKMVPVLIHLPPASDDVQVGTRDVREVVEEKISQAEVLYNLIAGTTAKGFKHKVFGQRHIAFEIVAVRGYIRFYAAVPATLVGVVEQAILTAYPKASLEEVEDHNIFSPQGKLAGTVGGEINLKQPSSYPIATFNQLKRDALSAIITALTSLGEHDGAGVQILMRPARPGWTKASESLVKSKRDGGGSSGGGGSFMKSVASAPFKAPGSGGDKSDEPPKPLSGTEQGIVDAIEEKAKHPGYEVLIRVMASSPTPEAARNTQNNIVAAFALFDQPNMNGFAFRPAKDMQKFVTDFILRSFPPQRQGNVLNSQELASLFHLIDDQFTHSSRVERQYSKEVDGPAQMPKDGLMLGYNSYRGHRREIRLSDIDRARHMYMVGQTGTGKTTLLENLAVQDMMNGRGFAYIDPHGDSAEKLLSMVPPERAEDVIYFNPGDLDYPLGLNLFEFRTEDQKDFLIQESINMLYKLYDPGRTGIIGPRYEHLFRNTALTAMADPRGSTLIDVPKVLQDKGFADQKKKYVRDPSVLDFWNKEMAQTSDYHKSEVLGWFVSKFGAFASNAMMRNIIGQTESAFDLREVMDSGKILLVNLSKGRMGELNSNLLGMIFVMKFQAAAMSRADIPESQRRDFTLYVDEFQNFSTDSFASILSEARKYKLSLVVANQYIGQLSEEIRDAVFGNVGTVVSLRASPSDADFLVKQFEPTFDASDITRLPNYQSIVRLMVNNSPSQPFSMQNMQPLGTANPKLALALKQLVYAKYAKPRQQVEDEIFERLKSPPAPTASARPASARPQTTTTGAKAAAGGNSFLDEWLARRRALRAQQQKDGTAPATPKPSAESQKPQQVTSAHRDPGVPPPPPHHDPHVTHSAEHAGSPLPPPPPPRHEPAHPGTPPSMVPPPSKPQAHDTPHLEAHADHGQGSPQLGHGEPAGSDGIPKLEAHEDDGWGNPVLGHGEPDAEVQPPQQPPQTEAEKAEALQKANPLIRHGSHGGSVPHNQ